MAEDARDGVTPICNQRERCIKKRTRVQGREARGEIEDGGEEKKRKNLPKNYRDDVKNGGELGRKRTIYTRESAG